MADITPADFAVNEADGWSALLINQTGTAVVNTTGEWCDLTGGYTPEWIAVRYTEVDGTGMTAAAITLQAKAGGLSTAFKIGADNLDTIAYAFTTTNEHRLIPLSWDNASTASVVLPLTGIDAIRASTAITGTAKAGDTLQIVVGGRRSYRRYP